MEVSTMKKSLYTLTSMALTIGVMTGCGMDADNDNNYMDPTDVNYEQNVRYDRDPAIDVEDMRDNNFLEMDEYEPDLDEEPSEEYNDRMNGIPGNGGNGIQPYDVNFNEENNGGLYRDRIGQPFKEDMYDVEDRMREDRDYIR
jgi:hypothetical protein